jgi:phospholipid/cholesterol/gamma-HCH transport system substrate-binding protein
MRRSFTIVMSGLIGTNYIGIDLGSIDAPVLQPGAEIRTKTTPDINSVMSQIGQLGQKLEGALGNIGTALAGDPGHPGIVQKIDQLVTDNRDKVGATLTNLQQITDKVNKGEGTLGRIISDPKLYDDLTATVAEIKTSVGEAKTFLDNAQAIMADIKSGKGTIGALVYDPKTAEDLKASIANVRAVSDKISRGEGTLGKLLSDDGMLRDAQAIMKKADRALDGLDDTGPITAVGVVAKGLF